MSDVMAAIISSREYDVMEGAWLQRSVAHPQTASSPEPLIHSALLSNRLPSALSELFTRFLMCGSLISKFSRPISHLRISRSPVHVYRHFNYFNQLITR